MFRNWIALKAIPLLALRTEQNDVFWQIVGFLFPNFLLSLI